MLIFNIRLWQVLVSEELVSVFICCDRQVEATKALLCQLTSVNLVMLKRYINVALLFPYFKVCVCS